MKKIFIIFLVFLFLLSRQASAHLPGQKPFFKINGTYTNLYPVTGSSLPDLILPQDLGAEPYVVNSEIHFEIDQAVLPVPQEIVKKTTFEWDMGDGTKGSGLSNKYTYTKVGSYLTTVNAHYEESTESQLIQSTLIHIVPDKAYKLPRAVISINGTIVEDPLTDFIEFDSQKTVRLDASDSESPSSKITEYFWDLGDGKSSTKKTVDHAYSPDYPLVFPMLRIKDNNGIIVDSYVQLESKELSTIGNPVKPGGLLPLLIIINVGVFAVGGAAYFFLRKREKK